MRIGEEAALAGCIDQNDVDAGGKFVQLEKVRRINTGLCTGLFDVSSGVIGSDARDEPYLFAETRQHHGFVHGISAGCQHDVFGGCGHAGKNRSICRNNGHIHDGSSGENQIRHKKALPSGQTGFLRKAAGVMPDFPEKEVIKFASLW